ncbi:MAG: hypothetical protein ACYS26_15105 [Planctomycetota bacterium]|jgi:hypothetical protein
MSNSRSVTPPLTVAGILIIGFLLYIGAGTLDRGNLPHGTSSAPQDNLEQTPESEALFLSGTDRTSVGYSSHTSAELDSELAPSEAGGGKSPVDLSSLPDLRSALAAYYGVSPYEVEQHLTDQLGLDAIEVLAMSVDSLRPWDSVSDTVIAGLVSKINSATPWTNERLIAELLGRGEASLQTTIREALVALSSEDQLKNNLELAVQHGVSTADSVYTLHLQLFSRMQERAIEKARSGLLDVFPVVNVNALLTHTRDADNAIFWAQKSYMGWTARVFCYREEDPRIDNAIIARDQSFNQWWADVKVIAGL